MSDVSANVDLVRSVYADWARGDYSSTEWAHPEIEYVTADSVETDSWTGTEVAEGWRGFLSAWEEFRIEADEIRELDEARVLVLTRYFGRGKRSGLDVGAMGGRGLSVFHIREGRVIRQVVYHNRDRGLAELGLTPGPW